MWSGQTPTRQSVLLEESLYEIQRQHAPSSASSEALESISEERNMLQEFSTSKKPRKSSSNGPGSNAKGNFESDQANSSGTNRPLEPAPGSSHAKYCNDLDKNISIGISGERPDVAFALKTLPRSFACPYNKFNPRKYGPWTDKKFKDCPGSSIPELCKIKWTSSAPQYDILLIAYRYHLKTAHTQEPSLLYCKRCLRSFENTSKLDDHYRALVACDLSNGSFYATENIEAGQWEQIDCILAQRGRKSVDDDARWYDIWHTLFPDLDQRDQPSSTREYRKTICGMQTSNYCRRRAPRLYFKCYLWHRWAAIGLWATNWGWCAKWQNTCRRTTSALPVSIPANTRSM